LSIDGLSEFRENLISNYRLESKLCFSFGFYGKAGNFWSGFKEGLEVEGDCLVHLSLSISGLKDEVLNC